MYGANIYGNSKKNHIDKLEKTHNKIIKYLLSTKKLIGSKEIKEKYKILGIKNLIIMKKLQFIFNFIQGNIPKKIAEDYIEKITQSRNHNRHLRSNNINFSVIIILNCIASNHSYKNTELWNDLPQEIKEKNKLKAFTKVLKNKLIN